MSAIRANQPQIIADKGGPVLPDSQRVQVARTAGPFRNGVPFLAALLSRRTHRRSHLRLSAFICGSICLHLLAAAHAAEIPFAERRSGYEFMSRETRAMQDDDTTNPGVLWVIDGETLWRRKSGAAGLACADCHGDARASMKGVAGRYPALDRASGRLLNLEGRINLCRSERQRDEPLAYESRDLLALTAYIARQSRGAPIEVAVVPGLQRHLDAGRALYARRQGQLDLACPLCHDQYWGRRLAGSVIPQAHPTGYPQYRLEWQTVGSLQRRIRNCLAGMRAELYEFGSAELVDLELYLMWRARGMKVEAPAVRP